MPFKTVEPAARRIAVIGGGIAGMAVAHLLAPTASMVLFEAAPRLGGHARTIVAGKRGDQPVDTGFIVYNKANYPHLVRLFDDLSVPVTESNMSFGASFGGGRMEYALANVNALFATRRNVVNPRFLRMLRDILHFNARAEAASQNPGLTIGELLRDLGIGDYFRDYYILPLSGAIWSTPVQGILDFPARALIRFFKNHALMSLSSQHQWYTVRGGSVEYVRRLHAALDAAGVDIRLSAPVAGVRRNETGAMVRPVGGDWEPFDQVIFATHSDVTLHMLEDPSVTERAALSAVRYQPNEAVLHSDSRLMPKRRSVWASWVYCEPEGPKPAKIDLTYWMNSLQPIPHDDPLFVTLNSNRPIDDRLIHDVNTFHHPVYDLAAIAAQDTIRAMNGTRNTWFCGAWMRNGFHEDGFQSAVDVVDAMQPSMVRIPA
jgi:uncharacterized protein